MKLVILSQKINNKKICYNLSKNKIYFSLNPSSSKEKYRLQVYGKYKSFLKLKKIKNVLSSCVKTQSTTSSRHVHGIYFYRDVLVLHNDRKKQLN